MKFKAELKEIKIVKTVSLDHQIKISLITDNKDILSLGAYPPDMILDVEITPENN